MRLSRYLGTTAAAIGVVALSLADYAVPARADPAPLVYAVLGDSTASGVGTGAGPQGGLVFSASNPVLCMRSSIAYGPLWAAAHPNYTLPADQMLTCSGAHVDSEPGAFSKSKAKRDVDEQIEELRADADLVSLAVGANDVGFSKIVEKCGLLLGNCTAAINTAKAYATVTLKTKLIDIYQDIHTKAPNAELVVMGYPHMYTIPGNCLIGSNNNRTAVNAAIDFMNDKIIKPAVEAAGSYASFADPRPAFTNHGRCASESWINSAEQNPGGAYHPTYLGHQFGYLPALTAVTG